MRTYGRLPRLVLETVIGWLLITAGIVMLVTPGPGLVTLLAGLAVLARHYRWAERVKLWALARVHDTATQLRAHRAARRAAGIGQASGPETEQATVESQDDSTSAAA